MRALANEALGPFVQWCDVVGKALQFVGRGQYQSQTTT